VLNRHVREFCDLAPLGLSIEPENLHSPFTRGSNAFLSTLQWLDKMTFGFVGMEMPRWVFYDCSEMPGGICGFVAPMHELPPAIVRAWRRSPDYEGPYPVSMAIAIPMVPEGAWLKHTLCSINELTEVLPAGLRTLSFAMALRLFQVKVIYSTTQWRSSELRVHSKFGELELLTAYTPAHTEPRTLTHRFEVTEARLDKALSGREAYSDPPPSAFFVDAHDVEAMIRLQRELESGRRIYVCGRPVRDGSATYVPLRYGD
jgi:hypothetical protein